MKVAIKTLGCKVNQCESDYLAALLKKENVALVDFDQEADCYIINSCAVTAMSEKKTRQWVSRALRKNQYSHVFLIGCYTRLPRQHIRLSHPRLHIIDAMDKNQAVLRQLRLAKAHSESSTIIPETKRARVWLKIEDGCDHFCRYCVVPHLRGSVRSEDPNRVIRQATLLENRGTQEIVLCGINLGMYGKETGKTHLIQLLEKLVKKTSVVRFRLSSIEPFLIDSEFLKRYFTLGHRVCPHFHIPLQSGCDQVLERMGRGYTTDMYHQLMTTIRQYDQRIAISTDIIVGFPGETDANFADTAQFFQDIGFSRAHIFIFSPRPFTPASQWEKSQGVPHFIKKERERILTEIIHQSQLKYYRSFIGKSLSVLVETQDNNRKVTGYSENYIPVKIESISPADYGHIIPVRIEEEHNNIIIFIRLGA